MFCLDVDEYRAALESGRLCKNFGTLVDHLQSFSRHSVKSGRFCHWCGETAFNKCGLCGVTLHNFPATGRNKDKSCSVNYHDLDQFGLAYIDSKILPLKRSMKWALPSNAAVQANKKHIDDSVLADI